MFVMFLFDRGLYTDWVFPKNGTDFEHYPYTVWTTDILTLFPVHVAENTGSCSITKVKPCQV